jgi:excisionase family DNA binding protein
LFPSAPRQALSHPGSGVAASPLHGETRSSVRILVDVPYAMRALSCGRTYVYELLKRGELPVVKLGRSTRIPVDALEAFVEERLRAARPR